MSLLIWSLILVPVIGILAVSCVPVMLMVERVGSAWMQRRVGPNRVGPWGLAQPIADAIKLVFKEENIPARANKVLFVLAPALAVLPPLVAIAVIPFAGTATWAGQEYPIQVVALKTSLLFLMAITSLHVYSVLAAGWSSNNKFSLMGALRASSQMISYEIAIGISVVALVLTYGTLDLREIVKAQEAGSHLPFWGCVLQPIAFLTLWISAFAETNRLPFDLPEGESELVAGYHSEYSGLKFGLFFMGEYVAMLVASCFLTTLFLGGYNVPFLSEAALRAFFEARGLGADVASIATVACQLLSFGIKVGFFMWTYVWVRWTLPRFRDDQLMDLGWRMMLPLGIFNAIATFVVTYFVRRGA